MSLDIRLTVLFEDPFWVGMIERTDAGKLCVCKVTFGAEPKDYEVYEHILRNYYALGFGPAIEVEARRPADNPKRRARAARKQTEPTGMGTKSQQALQLLREQQKQERKEKSRAERLSELDRLFERKQQKRKEKHKGH